MSYNLYATLAHPVVFAPTLAWIADSRIILLTPELAMIPTTNALYNQLSSGSFAYENAAIEQNLCSSFYFLSAPLAVTLEELSRRGTVAYIEADFFGGIGEQNSIVWRNRQILLGPIKTQGAGAINQALQLLGVQCLGFADEFDAVGLGLHRSNEEWLDKPGYEEKTNA